MTSTFATVTSNISVNLPVAYDCTFANQWTATRHIADYPSGAHWSPPVVASHSSAYTMWEAGILATSGVQRVAETGATGVLRGELANAGAEVLDVQIGTDMFPPGEPSQMIAGIDVDAAHRLLSSISMIAPSPDWISGFHDLMMADTETNTWFSTITIDTFPYDAGTDSGTTYRSSNIDTNPKVPIFQLTPSTVPSTGVFLDSAGVDVLPVATWTCVFSAGVTDHPTAAPVDDPSTAPSTVPVATDLPTAAPVVMPAPTMSPRPSFPPVPLRREEQPSPFRCRGRGRGTPGVGGESARLSRTEGCLRGDAAPTS